jgi:YaiO family outer membrane protein
MRKKGSLLFAIIFCLISVSLRTAADETNSKEKALQALKAKDYSTAIDICLGQLESQPENYEFNFILGRAYAYSRQWEKALSLLNRMLEMYPQNLDLLLFRSRVYAWKGEYAAAKEGFSGVLELDPHNREAMIGKAEIASWEKKFREARETYQHILEVYPGDPDVHYRIGRVYLWEGDYANARKYIQKAVDLEPENSEYIRALKNAHPEFSHKYELRLQYQHESFSDDRGNYLDHHFIFSMNVSPDIGSVHLKYNQTRRYGIQDSQFGIELYPHLWPKAYGYVDIGFSPDAIHYPRSSYSGEVYQSLFRGAEISLGYRRMNFANEAVPIYLGSVGYYIGSFYPFLRCYYTPEDEGQNFSWLVNVRRYFTKDSYLALGYGRGSRPFDIITIEDARVRKSWIFLAEWDWCFLKRIHLKIQYTHRNEESGPTRNGLFVATGYRW